MNSREPHFLDEIIDRRAVPAAKYHPNVLGDNGEELFAAGVADMDFRPPPAVPEALQQRLDHGIFGYELVPDTLFPALIQWFSNRYGWQIDESHILRAPNILNAIAMATSLFTKPGDGIIVQPPVFFDFFDILEENDRRIVSNPLILENGRYRMDMDDLEQKAADPSTTMIYLCNPHNPVGRVWSKKELQTLGDICLRHDVLVVSDEIHGDLGFTDHRYIPFASLGPDYARNCISCVSPAKTFNIPACCCAFTIVADDKKRQAFQAENSRLTVNKNNAFANVAIEAAYTQGEPWLEEVLTYLQENVNLVRKKLQGNPNVQLIEPEGTFLLWLDFRTMNLEPDELMDLLRNKAKWAVTRGHAFGKEGAGFIRLNIACPRSRLDAALDSLIENLN